LLRSATVGVGAVVGRGLALRSYHCCDQSAVAEAFVVRARNRWPGDTALC
jgi:hypothetical protein